MNQANTTPTVITTIAEIRRVLDGHRAAGRTIGFVPTMGYLHDGHGSLIRTAATDNDLTVISIFVNPLQFAADEDLSTYPRDLERDCALAGANGAALVFAPEVGEMYPHGAVSTSVEVDGLSSAWEGESRPSHFRGVATVVTKLFNIIGPAQAYFGEKDFQQLAVIRRMVADLSAPIHVVGCPIVREPDGLAMSSRNIYLSASERQAALVLRRALDEGERLIGEGARDPSAVGASMAAVVAAEPLAELDYAAAIDPDTLDQPEKLGPTARLVIAARLGSTRLIDNTGVTVGADQPTGA
ncbi:MAG: pantoate--beta-alanine ligase [Actinomycetota bacterium]